MIAAATTTETTRAISLDLRFWWEHDVGGTRANFLRADYLWHVESTRNLELNIHINL
jgi:hypothetical protein